MSEPLMPFLDTVTIDYSDDGDEIGASIWLDGELPPNHPVCVVPLDPASWHAAVERVAQSLANLYPPSRSALLLSSEDRIKQYAADADEVLRAFLALPPDWEPQP